jgi:hypothetical protein
MRAWLLQASAVAVGVMVAGGIIGGVVWMLLAV